MFYLPSSLISLIYEFSDQENQIKRRFTNDVLPCINKGWRVVGIKDGRKCNNCYSYGSINGSGCGNDPEICDLSYGGEFDIMSYEEYQQTTRCKFASETYDYWKTVYYGDVDMITMDGFLMPIAKQNLPETFLHEMKKNKVFIHYNK